MLYFHKAFLATYSNDNKIPQQLHTTTLEERNNLKIDIREKHTDITAVNMSINPETQIRL